MKRRKPWRGEITNPFARLPKVPWLIQSAARAGIDPRDRRAVNAWIRAGCPAKEETE